MVQNEIPTSPETFQRQLAHLNADIASACRASHLPLAAVRHLDSALAQIEALKSSCPCGSFKQYIETLTKTQGPDRFSPLIE